MDPPTEETPPPTARSKSSCASWNQRTERDRLKKSTPDREFYRFAKEETPNNPSEKHSFVSLNVCDVNQTLQYNEFTELSSSFDVICLTETKTDHKDELHRWPDFFSFPYKKMYII